LSNNSKNIIRRTAATKILATEAKKRGYTLCRHCANEYAEDMAGRQGCGTAAILFLTAGFSVLSASVIY